MITFMRDKLGDDCMNLLVRKFVGTKWTFMLDDIKFASTRIINVHTIIDIYDVEEKYDTYYDIFDYKHYEYLCNLCSLQDRDRVSYEFLRNKYLEDL